VSKERRAKFFYLFSFLIIACSLLFVGCPENIVSKLQEKGLELPEENPQAGMGYFSLNVTGMDARTIIPAMPALNDFAVFELAFSGVMNVTIERAFANLSDPINLLTGTYDLYVTAYLDGAKTKPAALGSLENFNVDEGVLVSRSVELTAYTPDGNKTGTFKWAVSYPSAVTAASMRITPLNAVTGTPVQTINILTGSFSHTSTVELNSGYYEVLFTLEAPNTKTLEWLEILHVYQSLESLYTQTFSSNYFNNNVYTVTLVFNNGDANGTQSRLHGDTATKPADPSRTGYVFDNWYPENPPANPAPFAVSAYNFSTQLIEDTTIYARWLGDIASASITIPPCTYNGSAQTPAPVVSHGGITLTAGTHYTVTSYANNTSAGTATVTINAVAGSGYTGTKTVNFTIDRQPIPNAVIDVSMPVKGTTRTSTAVVAGGSNFTAGTVSWSPTTSPSAANTRYTATVTLTAAADYTFDGGLTGTVTINGRKAIVSNNTGTNAVLNYQFQLTEADQYWESWTALPTAAGSTLGSSGTTNYRVNATATITPSVVDNGLNIAAGATVVIYIPAGMTLTVNGRNNTGTIGGGAGISLPSTSTLIIRGGGTLNANGGNGGNATNGSAGGNGIISHPGNGGTFDGSWNGGYGGAGGNGGGGGGAGIGSAGGSGGTGGAMVDAPVQAPTSNTGSLAGGNGNSGSTGGVIASAGTLYVLDTATVTATGGAGGSMGSGGAAGSSANDAGSTWGSNYQAGGGGGGGGGGAGANGAGIGAGGKGGGGGGSGGAGGRNTLASSNQNTYPTGEGGTGGFNGDGLSTAWGGDGTRVVKEVVAGGYGGAAGAVAANASNGAAYRATGATAAGATVATTSSAITYNTNGTSVTGMPANQTKYADAPEYITHLVPVRDAYTFIGWNTVSTATTGNYTANQSYTTNAALTLYAIWE